MNETELKSGLRRFSTGWGVTSALALVGLVFLSMTFGGTLQLRRGGDPFDALDSWGVPAFFVIWALMYLMRVIFWRRVPVRRQMQVRIFFVGLFMCELLAYAAGVWFLARTNAGPHPSSNANGPVITIGIAGVCQIATVVWLLRYRRE